MFVQDATSSALVIFLNEQEGNATVADPEGTSITSLLNDPRLSKIISSGFSGERINVERSTKASVDIKNPRVSMCIATQPDNFKRLIKKIGLITEGFLFRALILFTKPQRYRESIGLKVPSSIQKWYENKLQFLFNISYTTNTPYVLRFSEEAAKAWEESVHCLYDVDRNKRNKLAPWYGKMESVIARIAAIYHLFEADDPVNELIPAERIHEALELVLSAEEDMLQVYDWFFPDNVQDCIIKIIKWLDRERNTINSFTLSEASKAVDFKADVINQACKQLEKDGVLEVDYEHVSESGRWRRHYYRINHDALYDALRDYFRD